MEYIPQQKMMRALGVPMALAVFFLSGCMGGTTREFFAAKPEGPPSGGICEVAAMWKNEVVFTPDPANGGRKTPGIAGRLFFFDEKKDFPKAGEGAVVVDLYDMTHSDPKANTPPLEEWRVDKDTLQRLYRHDTVGWGYTVFLPWTTYRPDLTHIELKVRYVPVKGTPLYAESEPMTLNQDMNLTINESTRATGPPSAPAAGNPGLVSQPQGNWSQGSALGHVQFQEKHFQGETAQGSTP
ncbi:MAG: hypothetical protein ACJ8FY_15485 [Gemmataceae bacterium]